MKHATRISDLFKIFVQPLLAIFQLRLKEQLEATFSHSNVKLKSLPKIFTEKLIIYITQNKSKINVKRFLKSVI